MTPADPPLPPPAPRGFVLKAAIDGVPSGTLRFAAQKTMYGGKGLAVGDRLYLFASETGGGAGLVARGRVAAVGAVPRRPDLLRQTPRIDLVVDALQPALRRLGRAELKPWTQWADGRPQTELNFKLYRQATDKVVGVSPATAAWLDGYFATAETPDEEG